MNAIIKSFIMSSLVIASTFAIYAKAQSASYQNSYQTYVIHTYGGAALLPAVRQQLNSTSDGGSASIYQDKLILKTTAANYQSVQQLLGQIDNQPQALTVAVRVGNSSDVQSNIQQGRVIISDRGIQGTGVINQSNTSQQGNNLYQVQTLSGSGASISTGTLYSLTQNYPANGYPVNSYPSYNRPAGQIIIQHHILLPTMQGIQVIPRLLADGQVKVHLSQVEEKLVSANTRYNQNSAIQGQRLNSTIIVSRGQWVTIGQVSQNSQTQNSSYGSSRNNITNASIPIQLLVQ